MTNITPRTKLLGILFFCAWILGAVLVDLLHMPTAIYAILVVGFEIASIGSVAYDLIGNNENNYLPY
jgi:hypothetical protein